MCLLGRGDPDASAPHPQAHPAPLPLTQPFRSNLVTRDYDMSRVMMAAHALVFALGTFAVRDKVTAKASGATLALACWPAHVEQLLQVRAERRDAMTAATADAIIINTYFHHNHHR